MTSGGQGNKCESKLSHSRKEAEERIPTHSARIRAMWGKKWPMSLKELHITGTLSRTDLRIPVLRHETIISSQVNAMSYRGHSIIKELCY